MPRHIKFGFDASRRVGGGVTTVAKRPKVRKATEPKRKPKPKPAPFAFPDPTGSTGITSTRTTTRSPSARQINVENQLKDLRQKRLTSALAALNAQFDTTKGGLDASLRDLGTEFDIGIRGLDRRKELTTEAVGDEAASRGILRSGIFAKNTARALQPIADERADLIGRLSGEEGSEGTEVRDIMAALSLLEQKRTGALSEAEISAEQEELSTELLRILAGTGVGA